MKPLLSIGAVAGAFFVVLVGGGTAVGVWKELNLPATSAAADKAVRSLAPASGGKATPAARKKAQRAAKAAAAKANRAQRKWLRAANAICREATREDLGDVEPKTVAEAEQLVARAAELNERYNNRLRALQPPPGESGRVTRLMKLLDKDEAAIDRLLQAIREREPIRIDRASDRLVVIAEREATIMYELGAFECAL